MMNGEHKLSLEFMENHSLEAAQVLEQLPVDEIVLFLSDIPDFQSAILIKYLPSYIAVNCLEKLEASKSSSIISKLPLETASVLLRQMDEFYRMAILKKLPEDVTESFSLMLKYPENTVGAIMNPHVFTLYEDITVKNAIKQIRKYSKNINDTIPVLNREYIFKGIINISELLLKKPELNISSMINSSIGKLLPSIKFEVIFKHSEWQIYHELPVVDNNGIFLGILSYKTICNLEEKFAKHEKTTFFNDSSKALGELYWLGISAFVNGAASVVKEKNKKH